MPGPTDSSTVEHEVRDWIERVVVGLRLCPFAARLDRDQQLRVAVCEASETPDLLQCIGLELERLDGSSPDPHDRR